MIRSLVLFTHIVGMLLLSAAIALEWAQGVAAQSSPQRRSSPGGETALYARLYPAAGLIILLTGGYLATAAGLWSFGWVRLSFAAVFALALIGRIAGLASLYVRTMLFLGVVYLMIAKPDLAAAMFIILVASSLGAALTLGLPRPAAVPTRR